MRRLLLTLLLAALPTLGSAQTKISALPAATTPLVGTEVVACVQSGVTDKCTTSSIAAFSLSVFTPAADSNSLGIGKFTFFQGAGYTGVQNVGVGFSVFETLTSGGQNTAVGYAALTNDSTGSENTAVGATALLTPRARAR